MVNRKFMFLVVLVVVSGCASYEHVRPGADGVHHVIIRGVDKTDVEKEAIGEAKAFCDDRKLSAAFVQEESKYTGSMNESTHKNIGKVSGAAAAGGGMMKVLGGSKEKNIGEGLFGAGAVGTMFQDKDAYTADMKFKCI